MATKLYQAGTDEKAQKVPNSLGTRLFSHLKTRVTAFFPALSADSAVFLREASKAALIPASLESVANV